MKIIKITLLALFIGIFFSNCDNPNVNTSIPKPSEWYYMLGHHKDQIKFWMDNNDTFSLNKESDSVLVYKGNSYSEEWVITLHNKNSIIDQITHTTVYLLQPSFGTYGDMMTKWLTNLRRDNFIESDEEKYSKEGSTVTYMQKMANLTRRYFSTVFLFWDSYKNEGNVSVLFKKF